METDQARHSPQTRSAASIVGEYRSFMTAVPNEAKAQLAGSHRLLNPLPLDTRVSACERSENLSSRVSDVSATGTERSGACTRPVLPHRHHCRGAVRDCHLRWPNASRAERSAVKLKARSHAVLPDWHCHAHCAPGSPAVPTGNP